MHDVLAVGDGKRLADLAADFGDLTLVDGAALLDRAFQVGAAHVFHDDEVRALVLAPVVDVHDVGALQVGRRSRFLFEAGGEFGVGGVLGQHDLHGYGAAENLVLRLVHLGHAADAYAFGDFVPSVEHPSYHDALPLYQSLVASYSLQLRVKRRTIG